MSGYSIVRGLAQAMRDQGFKVDEKVINHAESVHVTVEGFDPASGAVFATSASAFGEPWIWSGLKVISAPGTMAVIYRSEAEAQAAIRNYSLV